MAMRVSSPTLIGRGRELARVLAASEAARAGHSAVVLVAGEAGVGKTRFLREVIHRFRDAGGYVLEGGCVQVGTDGLPYGPLIEALRGLSSDSSEPDLDALLGSGRAELARLMPHLEHEGEGALTQGPLDGSAQGRLFEHLLLLFGRLAAQRPLMVAMEDIHWADRSTLDLLAFLARNLRQARVIVLVTYRTDELDRSHPLLPFLAEQARRGGVERIDLSRFERSEILDLSTAILGDRPDSSLAASIWERSQGNAFFVEELLASTSSAGGLPDTLRDVLLARLAGLTERTQELVRLAAAGGALISPALLAKILGIAEPDLDDALREAVAHHVLVPHERAGDTRFEFRHALVQEAAYSELLPGERSRVHAGYAQVLAKIPGRDASRAMELAHHWEAAGDLPRAFDARIQAGLAAEAIYASAEARAGFEHALELWDQIPDATARSPLDRVELLMRAAFHAEGPAPERSLAHVGEAIGLVDPTIDPTRAGMLHERLGQYSWNLLASGPILTAYEDAVRLVPADPPSHERAWVLAGLGRCYSELDRPADAVARCSEALAVARTVGDRHVEARALVVLGRSLAQLGDVDEGLATIARARDIAAELGDLHEAANALTWLVAALHEAGRASEAVAASLEVEAFATRHGLRSRWGAGALERGAWALFGLGRWDEAVEMLGRAQSHELPGLNYLVVEAALLMVETLRGEFENARRRVTGMRLGAEKYPDPVVTSALAEFALWQGHPGDARAAITLSVASPDSQARYIGFALRAGIRAEVDIAEVARSRAAETELADCRARGAVLMERMRQAHAEVRARLPGALPRVDALLVACEAELTRLEGMSDPDRWASTAVAWTKSESQYQIAYARMREGEAILARQRDRPRAARALKEAWAIADRLGALPLAGVIETLAGRANIALESRTAGPVVEDLARTTRAPEGGRLPRDPSGLTRREREVLLLVAAGRSDGEIAEELFISKKTASFHVAMIKGKLGARSRVEIATDAIGLGLIQAPASPRT